LKCLLGELVVHVSWHFNSEERGLTIGSQRLLDHVGDLLDILDVLQDYLFEARKVFMSLCLNTIGTSFRRLLKP
jgi:hypothetical protein